MAGVAAQKKLSAYHHLEGAWDAFPKSELMGIASTQASVARATHFLWADGVSGLN